MKTKNQASVNIIEDSKTASSLLNPMRRQMLEHLKEPNSASGLARILHIPRQKVNYHLRELEKRGLVEFVKENKRGNCVERILQATARSYLISLESVGQLPLDAEQIKNEFSSTYLIAVASNMINEVAQLKTKAEKANKKLATFTLQSEIRLASPKSLNSFTEELSQFTAKLITKYHDEQTPKGRKYKFNICAHPSIIK